MLIDTGVSYDKQRKDSAHLTNKNINILLLLLYRTVFIYKKRGISRLAKHNVSQSKAILHSVKCDCTRRTVP